MTPQAVNCPCYVPRHDYKQTFHQPPRKCVARSGLPRLIIEYMIVRLISLTLEFSSTSLHKPLQSSSTWSRKFLAKELQPHLTSHIDFQRWLYNGLVAKWLRLTWHKNWLLNFSGDEHDKNACYKNNFTQIF